MWVAEDIGGLRWQVCENIKVTDTFTSFTTKNTFKINHSFDCNDKCLIYLFNWKTYGKQYTSKTISYLEVGGTVIYLELEKLRMVTWKMSNKNSQRVVFYNQMIKTFLKMWKLGWFIKHRVLTRSSGNFSGWEYLKLKTISNCCFTSTFVFFLVAI